MPHFICPICKSPLFHENSVFVCQNNHTYDISKNGYINLLLSQKAKEKNHGDDNLMVKSRSQFLNVGYYEKLLWQIVKTLEKYLSNEPSVLDVGCGEGYYTNAIFESLKADMNAIDISKIALAAAAKRNNNINFAVASAAAIPLSNESVHGIVNVFAPACGEEFSRVLKKNGILLKVIPLENHLFKLKSIIYEKPYKNQVLIPKYEGFKNVENIDVKYKFDICGNDLQNLFMMTPYYYKTSNIDKEKLLKINDLDCEAEFRIFVYEKE